jgi:hypothetical protein
MKIPRLQGRNDICSGVIPSDARDLHRPGPGRLACGLLGSRAHATCFRVMHV